MKKVDIVSQANDLATRRMSQIKQNIDEAAKRADAVHNNKMRRPAFETFSRDRIDAVKQLSDNPPYGIAGAVKAGSLLVGAGLAVYSTFRSSSDKSNGKK